jgi:hypothetical protein
LSRALYLAQFAFDVASRLPDFPPGFLGGGDAYGEVGLGASDPCRTVVAGHIHVLGDRCPEHEQIECHKEGAQADKEHEEPSRSSGSYGRSFTATDGDWTRSGLLSGGIVG